MSATNLCLGDFR